MFPTRHGFLVGSCEVASWQRTAPFDVYRIKNLGDSLGICTPPIPLKGIVTVVPRREYSGTFLQERLPAMFGGLPR